MRVVDYQCVCIIIMVKEQNGVGNHDNILLCYTDMVTIATAEIVSRKKMATSWMYYVHYVECKWIV